MKKQVLEYTLWLVALLVVFTAAWQLISGFYHRQVLDQQEDYLVKKGELLIQLSQQGQDLATLQSLSKDYVQKETERVTLLDASGNIRFDTSRPELSGTRSDRPEVKTILAGGKLGVSVRTSDTLKEELLYVAIPIAKDNQLTAVLRIAESTAGFLAEAGTVKRSIFIVYCILCLMIITLVLYFLRQKNRPLQTVLPVLKKMIAQPDRNETILQSSPQWQELYQTINQLSGQLSQTYQAYEAAESQLHTLLNELMIGVFIVDDQQRLVMINASMEEQLGIYRPINDQPNFAEVIQDPLLIQLIYRVTTQREPLHEEIVLSVPLQRYLEIDLRIFNENQILGISYDLTRTRQLEKMQQDFVGNVSHELKTPVTSLIGFTETLLAGAKDDPETTTAFLEIMEKDAKRLERLIQDIIQLSRRDNTLHYPLQEIQLAELFAQLQKTYQHLLTNKQINLVLIGDQQLTWKTKVELFYPIIKNLLENAIQYSPEKAQITITYQKDRYLTITVADNGIGIDTDDQQRIFERFYRVDKARARNSGGTGLGLAIVKDYTQQLGGTVEVNSHPGVGTRFTVTLPALTETS